MNKSKKGKTQTHTHTGGRRGRGAGRPARAGPRSVARGVHLATVGVAGGATRAGSRRRAARARGRRGRRGSTPGRLATTRDRPGEQAIPLPRAPPAATRSSPTLRSSPSAGRVFVHPSTPPPFDVATPLEPPPPFPPPRRRSLRTARRFELLSSLFRSLLYFLLLIPLHRVMCGFDVTAGLGIKFYGNAGFVADLTLLFRMCFCRKHVLGFMLIKYMYI